MTPRPTGHPSPRPAAAHAGLPRTIEPMTAASADEPFDSTAYIFELLWEGLRAVLFVEGRSVRLHDRYGRDVTHRFPELALLHHRLPRSGTAVDGMIVAHDDDGSPAFNRLLPRLLPATAGPQAGHVAFQAFDVLYRNGEPIMEYTLRRRKEILAEIVRPSNRIIVPDHVQTDGIALFEAARDHNLGGIVAKELNATYEPGAQSHSWLAIRTAPKQNFVVGGFTYGGPWRGRKAAQHRGPIESVLVGLYDDAGRLHFVGEASGSFHRDDPLVSTLDSITTDRCPFADPPPVSKLVFWCRPQFVASVRYAEWTPTGALRFPVFDTLRPDVPPETLRSSEPPPLRSS